MNEMNQKLAVVAAMAVVAGIFAFKNCSRNEITGENQIILVTPQQEIALGLQSARQVEQQYGGGYRDAEVVSYARGLGRKLVQSTPKLREGPYKFEFHVLDDPKTVNAFALPGGQVFITTGLLFRLENEAQLAGVLGHEIGHVAARHGAEQITKQYGAQMVVAAAAVLGSDDRHPGRGEAAAAAAQMVTSLATLKYGRDDELQADQLGVDFMANAGYDPRTMIGVMKILEKAGGGGRQPEFFSTHPNPENRIGRIQQRIDANVNAGLRWTPSPKAAIRSDSPSAARPSAPARRLFANPLRPAA